MYGDNVEYARTRLLGTIVTYKGEPVNITAVVNDRKGVTCSYVSFEEEGVCPVDNLDLTPLKLGFVNTPYGTGFLSRMPKRHDWRQGLRDQNCNVYGDVPKRMLMELKSLRLTTKNIFPSIEEAIAKCTAFSRNFAVMKGGNLMYKNEVVGGVERGALKFLPQYQYLKLRLDRTFN